MRKVILFMHNSLDGYCATPEGGLDWIPYNKAFEQYAERIVQTAGSPMYGRVTYELMQSYWPKLLNDASASKHDKEHAQWYDKVQKIVFSTTLMKEERNTTVIHDDVEEAVKKLKEQDGKDLVIFGSPTLARSLMSLGLIDEFQFTVSPVVLGKGLTFLRSIDRRVNLELLSSEQIEGGMVALHYKVKV
jgi:dihydrofolate reductase